MRSVHGKSARHSSCNPRTLAVALATDGLATDNRIKAPMYSFMVDMRRMMKKVHDKRCALLSAWVSVMAEMVARAASSSPSPTHEDLRGSSVCHPSTRHVRPRMTALI